MSKLEKTYLILINAQKGRRNDVFSPAMVLITFVYLVALLSVPVSDPQKLVWLSAFPIILSEFEGLGYGKIFIGSLWILPLVILIGLFNPIFDTTPAFRIGDILVSQGWVSFISIILRGLLSMQVVLIMVRSIGFLDLFNSLRGLHVPVVLCTQLLLTYRYLTVLLEEANILRRAVISRGSHDRSMSVRLWGRIVGQILIRSFERSKRIHLAMKARGFNGLFPISENKSWNHVHLMHFILWTAFILALRFIDFSKLIIELLK